MKGKKIALVFMLLFLALMLAFAFVLLYGGMEPPEWNNEIPNSNDSNTGLFFVSRVIDGDTIELASKENVRLLGINTPEKNEFLYAEAKKRAVELMEKKTVKLIQGKENTDKYGRLLRFVEVDGAIVNLLLVREGLATVYLSGANGLYFNELNSAQDYARENENGLWKKSKLKNAECIKLNELNEFEEFVKIKNNCSNSIDLNGVSIKDSGRNKFVFSDEVLEANSFLTLHSGKGIDSEQDIYWNSASDIWNNDFDSLFLRDENHGLILFYEYS